MQIAVNCKKHQAYQYGAFNEAFIHIGMYSGHCRRSDDSSLRTKLSCAPRRLGVIRHGYMHRRWLHLFYPYTCEFFISSHNFAWYCFCLASRGHGVLIFGVPVLFLHSGARGVGGPVCKLGGRESFKGGVFGFASVVVFWRKGNTLFQTLPQNVSNVQGIIFYII
jgi:hypothetical protein